APVRTFLSAVAPTASNSARASAGKRRRGEPPADDRQSWSGAPHVVTTGSDGSPPGIRSRAAARGSRLGDRVRNGRGRRRRVPPDRGGPLPTGPRVRRDARGPDLH